MDKNLAIVKNHVPEKSIPILQLWFQQRTFELKITKQRSTKFGDFRTDHSQQNPRISINHNLNQYAFLITLTHEFAHLLVWNRHKHQVKAHGEEWKREFKLLINTLLQKNIFPNKIAIELKRHMANPSASSARDIQLVKALKEYDATTNNMLHLSEIPEGSTFSINNQKIFIKGNKQRTRYLCKEVKSKKQYFIHGVAEVVLIN
ncbi:MAG: SprT-like domain-containing protein [Vicingus serpentipes]|nr:SprT-like domain-containing protein [Vicingus serpentipes]